jgi:putative glutamine amidotransferase
MISRSYIAALDQVGARAVLWPSGTRLPDDLDWVSGVLLPGGGDVEPRRYGAVPHPASVWDAEQDQLDFHLLEVALRAQIPVLGICRGLQVINVHFGGTLVQDLPAEPSTAVRHAHDGPRDDLAHTLQVEPGTRLGDLLGGGTLLVNSLHHQGIDFLAPRLRVAARSGDGLVEGIEARDGIWVVGVQFHPEELIKDHHFALQLFQGFADQCAHVWTERRLRDSRRL